MKELLSVELPPREKWLISCYMFFHAIFLAYKYFPKMISYSMLVSVYTAQASFCTNKNIFTSGKFQPVKAIRTTWGLPQIQAVSPFVDPAITLQVEGCPQVTVVRDLDINGSIHTPQWFRRRRAEMLSCTSIYSFF